MILPAPAKSSAIRGARKFYLENLFFITAPQILPGLPRPPLRDRDEPLTIPPAMTVEPACRGTTAN